MNILFLATDITNEQPNKLTNKITKGTKEFFFLMGNKQSYSNPSWMGLF